MKRGLVVLLVVWSVIGVGLAQDTDVEDRVYRVPAWLVTDLDTEEDSRDNEDSEVIGDYVVFLWIDDDTLLEVRRGEDVVYTRTDDGTITGTPLLPPSYEFSATLTIVDDDTIEVSSEVHSGSFTSQNQLHYERTYTEIGVWVEQDRDLTEYTMFAECMGRESGSPPLAFAEPDPILPILIDDEGGKIVFGDVVLRGGGGSYELEETGDFMQFVQIITQKATVSEERIDFSYHAIADDRDDCELHYETHYIPFDGDFEAFFAYVEVLAEEENG